MATKYKLLNNNDGNDEMELPDATYYEEALEHALEALGWNLIAYEDEEDEGED